MPVRSLAGIVVALMLSALLWVGWRGGVARGDLAVEMSRQYELSVENRRLLAIKEKLKTESGIVTRASTLGLFPAKPHQVRMLPRW